MKKLCLIIVGILILPAFVHGSDIIMRLSFVTPKLVVEVAPAYNFSFTTGVMFRPTFTREGADGEKHFTPIPSLNPKIYLEPRFFFNQDYRLRQGKRTDYYSGWFAGIPFTLGIPNKNFSLAPVIGFQCTFGRRWYWNWETGPGMRYADGHFKIRPYVDVGFGVVLN